MEFKKIALSFVVAFSLCTVTAQAQDAVKCDKPQQEQACPQAKKCPKHAKACCDSQPAKPCCKSRAGMARLFCFCRNFIVLL